MGQQSLAELHVRFVPKTGSGSSMHIIHHMAYVSVLLVFSLIIQTKPTTVLHTYLAESYNLYLNCQVLTEKNSIDSCSTIFVRTWLACFHIGHVPYVCVICAPRRPYASSVQVVGSSIHFFRSPTTQYCYRYCKTNKQAKNFTWNVNSPNPYMVS